MGVYALIVSNVIIPYVLLVSDRKDLMKDKILLIGNPATGHGGTKHKIVRFSRQLESRGHRAEIYLTSRAGDAMHIASRLEPDVKTLVVAGGDGTLNEVINGLKDPSRIPIAILPIGTANVLANELGIPADPESLAQTVILGNVQRIDMGIIGTRRFMIFVNIGIDAMITEQVFRNGKTGAGYWRYLLPVLKVLTRYRVPNIRVVIDGGKNLTGGLVHIGNTRRYGGIFSISDQAQCDSGLFDVCVFPRTPILTYARYYFAAARGHLSRIKDISYTTGKTVLVNSDKPLAVQADGEYFGTTPVLIKIQPSTVPVIVPDDGNTKIPR